MIVDHSITALIPTSPIPSHPSTEIIERVVSAVRFHLPESRIIIMCDGLRDEVKHRGPQYADYKNNLKVLANTIWKNVVIKEFTEHLHQAAMTRETMKDVITPLTLFNEHDAYLVTDRNPRDIENTGRTDHPEDRSINWKDISDIIASGGVNMVRFYLWEKIWHEHEYLMCGQMLQGESTFIQTRQFSGWPNIASSDFYRKILTENFPEMEKRMIELGMYGPVARAPWEKFRIAIYHPQPNARRFFHLNGRLDEETGVRDLADGSMDWK